MAKVHLAQASGKPGISLMTKEALEQIQSLSEKGLCMARFKADCVVDGLAFSSLKTGDRLRVGTMTVLITRCGKACHGKDCQIFDGSKTCFMTQDILFGDILVDGTYKSGDNVALIR